MKSFQIILLFVTLILIGGAAALYWGKSVEEVTSSIAVVEESVEEPTEEELSSGSYLIFNSVEVTDPGTEDWTNDDEETYTFYRLALGEATYRAHPSSEDLVEFVAIKHPASIHGALTSYIFGSDILLHRYQKDNQDAILSLAGDLVETSLEDWSRFRSSNGRYEVRYDFDREAGDEGSMEVVDVAHGTTLYRYDLMLDSGEIGNPVPFLIDDQGTYVYAHQMCDCGATLSGLWSVSLETGEETRLDMLVDLDSWFLSSIDSQGGRLLAIRTQRGLTSEEGAYPYELLPPTTIRVLDLDSGNVRELIVDEERVWDQPILDPRGGDRYVVRSGDDEQKVYVVDIADTEITQDDYLTDGWVLDWVGDWLVVQNIDNASLKLVNMQTKKEVPLQISSEQVRYIGSIRLE